MNSQIIVAVAGRPPLKFRGLGRLTYHLQLLDIIYEDGGLLVVNKPAGLVCHPTKGDEFSSLISRVRLYLGAEGHLVNRLDRETSGVTVVAKNSTAAGELGKLWENRGVRKEYIAIVHGAVRDDSGTIGLALGKDERSQIAIKDCARADGAAARTEFLVERRFRRGGRDFSVVAPDAAHGAQTSNPDSFGGHWPSHRGRQTLWRERGFVSGAGAGPADPAAEGGIDAAQSRLARGFDRLDLARRRKDLPRPGRR